MADGFAIPKELEGILNAMSDGVWVCDSTPKLIWINRACEELNDIRREEVVGRRVNELRENRNFDHDVTSLVMARKKPVAINQKVRSGRTLLVNGVPVFGEDGEVAYIVGTERDLTELNELRSELYESKELTKKINSELLALRMKELRLSDIVVSSEAMERVLDTALKVAGFDSTVLLTGPSGTGKSLIAKLIHQASQRRRKPFLSLNAGAIPSALIEAELFGYAAGAFTGAAKGGKPGLLQAADGGTLFLDEVGELPPEVQVKLLTFLDTQHFIPVGDTKVREVDVRLVTATNRDLSAMVADRTFREDLWFRLNVVPISIPSLKDRRDDIAPLVHSYLAALSKKHGVTKTVSPEALNILHKHQYPGNVRELFNILERSFVLSDGMSIDVSDLPPEIQALSGMASGYGGQLKDVMENFEGDFVRSIAAGCSRQVDLADRLGISQASVARLLKKHRISLSRTEYKTEDIQI